MIELSVARLGLDSVSKSYVVILQEKEGSRLLPIWIGQAEAESIVMHMKNIRPPRPMTHDLCRRLISGLGGALQRVQITKVEDNTYFAELHIQRGESVFQVDARPSDSIAIALRFDAPIFAPESLLSDIELEDSDDSGDSPAVPESQRTLEQRRLEAEELKEHLERMRPEDFGKFNF